MKENKCTECDKTNTTIKHEGKWYCSDCHLLFNDTEAYCYYEAEEIRKGVKKIV